MEESIVGILLASCVHTVIAGAKRKEESEWAMALDNIVFRYILITSVAYMITKNIKKSFMILFLWIITKTFLKLSVINRQS